MEEYLQQAIDSAEKLFDKLCGVQVGEVWELLCVLKTLQKETKEYEKIHTEHNKLAKFLSKNYFTEIKSKECFAIMAIRIIKELENKKPKGGIGWQ